jgi:hypothetical protein
VSENQPAAVGWLDAVRLLTGSQSGIGLVRVDAGSNGWPAAVTLLSAAYSDVGDVRALAPVPNADGGTFVFLLRSNAPGLFRASLAGTPASIQSLESLDLGNLEPLAVATAADGASILAAAREPGIPSVRLLQVRSQ